MSDLYYGSAAEAGSDLGLPLLLVASPSAAVPRHGERSVGFRARGLRWRPPLSPAPHHAGSTEPRDLDHRPERDDGVCGLGRRLRRACGARRKDGLSDRPRPRPSPSFPRARRGTSASPIGRRPDPSPRRAGRGGMGDRSAGRAVWFFRRWKARGVRRDPIRAGRSSSSPERCPTQGEGIVIPPGAIEGVCFAAAIRDHTREELRGSVAGLRRSGHQMLGFIAMGPTPVSRHSPLDRWERVAPAARGSRRRGGRVRPAVLGRPRRSPPLGTGRMDPLPPARTRSDPPFRAAEAGPARRPDR